MCKHAGKIKYGLLSSKEVESICWKILNVDFCWGPKSRVNVNDMIYKFYIDHGRFDNRLV